MKNIHDLPTYHHWKHFNPDDTGPFKDKADAKPETEKLLEHLDQLQYRLYAEGRRSLLIILQGMDTSGKDGTIRHVMSGVSPQSCQVTSFKVPTAEERAHDFLWRIHRAVPAAGNMGIFNRSLYEDVLVTRVHGQISDDEAKRRFNRINDFEKLLVQSGTTILKFYLGISKEEQKKRLESRLKDPDKRWKLSPADIAERRFWPQYQKYYAEAIKATSTKHAPWYLVPANHKWYRNHFVAYTIVKTLKEMNPQFPPAAKGLKNLTIQ
jgi:PPK2 family polyphosphate:nucleotide phosphotransferase